MFLYVVLKHRRAVSTNCISNLGGNPVLLWTNPYPTADFSAQTINLDLSGYEAVIIQFSGYNRGLNASKVYLSKDENLSYFGAGFIDGQNGHGRNITSINDNGISFSDERYGTYVSNGFVAPYKIWGLKKKITLE